MRLKLPQALAGAVSTRAGRKGIFRVVMVYDDFAAGKRAMDTCHFLAQQLGGGIEFNRSMWKFDVLRCAKLKQMAVQDTLEADVVIVATGQNSGLPPEVTDWLKRWVPARRGGAAALVALIDYTGEHAREPARAQAILQQAATAAGIDFLSQEIRPMDVTEPIGPNPARYEPSGQGHEDILRDRASPHGWGLND